MNLLNMTEEQKLEAIRTAKANRSQESMGNAPLADGDKYIDFIIEGYDLKGKAGRNA